MRLQMKVRIDWTNAPEWARYLVQNARGTYVWCEQPPYLLAGKLHAGKTQVAQEFWDLETEPAPTHDYAHHIAS